MVTTPLHFPFARKGNNSTIKSHGRGPRPNEKLAMYVITLVSANHVRLSKTYVNKYYKQYRFRKQNDSVNTKLMNLR